MIRLLPDIREGEGGRFAFVTTLNFLVLFGLYMGRAARDAFFYVNVGVQYLPVMFAATALFAMLVNALYSDVISKMRQERLYLWTLGMFGLTCVGLYFVAMFRFNLARGFWGAWIVYGSIFAVTEAMAVILVVATATFVNDPAVFGLGGIKRLAPFYVSFGHLGSIAAGVVALTLAHRLGLETFILAWAGTLLLGLVLALAIVRNYYRSRLAIPGGAEPETGGFWSDLKVSLSTKYLRAFILVTVLNFVLGAGFEWMLSRNATALVKGDAEELTRYLGWVYVWGGLAAFVFQAFILARLIRRVGVARAHYGAPISLCLGAAALVIAPNAIMAAVAARVSFFVAENAFNQTLIRFVYNVVDERNRMRVQAFIESSIITGSVALAGLLLWGFGATGAGPLLICVALLVLAVLMFAFTRVMMAEYKTEVRRNYVNLSKVGRARLFEDILSGQDSSSRELVAFVEDNNDSKSLALAIDTVSRLRLSSHYESLVYGRLSDTRREVQLAAIRAVAKIGQDEDAKRLDSLLQDADPEVVIAALRAQSELSGAALPVAKLQNFLDHDDPKIVSAAIAQLMQNTGVDGMQVAIDRMKRLRDSTDVRDRVALVRTFGELGQRSIDDLREQLVNQDLDVRTAVVEALGGVESPLVLPDLYEALDHPRLRPVAQRSLLRQSKAFSRRILAAFRDPRVTARRHLAAVLAEMDTPESELAAGDWDEVSQLLRAALDDEDFRVREAAARALAKRVEARHLPGLPLRDFAERLRSAVEDIVRSHLALEVVESFLTPEGDPLRLVRHRLEQRRSRITAHLFDILVIVNPESNLIAVYANLRSPSRREEAVEVLENVLSRRVFDDLIVLFDAAAFDACRTKCSRRLQSPDDAVRHLVQIGDEWLNHSLLHAYRRARGGRRPGLSVAPAGLQLPEDPDMQTKLDKAHRLVASPLFSDVPLDDLIQVAEGAQEVEYPAGTLIYAPDQSVDRVFVVVEGRVAILTSDGSGLSTVLHVLDAPATLGELCVFQDAALGEGARAETTVKCLILSREDAARLVELHPEMIHRIVRTLWERLNRLNQQVMEHSNIGKRVSMSLRDMIEQRLGQLELIPEVLKKLDLLSAQRVVIHLDGLESRQPALSGTASLPHTPPNPGETGGR
jgi:CRP/FNR family transcriptional regulator